MEAMTYLKIIGRYWWVVLLTALISTGAAAGISLTRSKQYSVQARVVAKPATSVLTETRDLVNMISQMGMRSVIGTFAQVFTSAEVERAAQAATGMSEADAREYPIQANVLPDTTVIEISSKGRDPQVLANYVNATVDAAIESGRKLYEVIDLEPLERASIPKEPTSPVPSRDIPIGAGLGLALGILLALAIEYLRTPRKPEYEAPIRPLPQTIMALGALPPQGATPQQLGREDLYILNGGQPSAGAEYLTAGRQQRSGATPALQAGKRRDGFPG